MNNCCDSSYQDGGTINEPQILNPEIVGGILKGVELAGGVTLDDSTATALVERLCPLLNDCILNTVDGSNLSDMVLSNTTLKGAVTLDSEAVKAVVSGICSELTDCIIKAVQSNVIDGIKLTKAEIDGLSLRGSVTTDTDAALSIATAVADHLDDHIRQVVLSSTLDAIKLSSAEINGLSLSGSVTLDEAASKSIVDGICTNLKDCILNTLKGSTLDSLTLESPTIKGALKFDKDASDSIGAAIGDKVSDMVNEALTSGKLCCMVIDGAEINNSHGTNNTWTDTVLNGNTTINGTLTLGPDAIGNLCSSLQKCIDERFIEMMKDRGRVVTDKDTILGNGTEDDPLRTSIDTEVDERLLPAETTQSELPTTIIGSRDKLLGKPDYFIRIGKHVLPAWKG